MHLKFGNFVLYTPLYRLMERKQTLPCTQLSMRKGGANSAFRARQGSCRIA